MSKGTAELKRAFEEFRGLAFPHDSDDDELSQLHAELAEYDGHIAGLVSTIIAGGSVSWQLLKLDHDLKTRLEKIALSGSPKAMFDARLYLEYLNALSELADQARAQEA